MKGKRPKRTGQVRDRQVHIRVSEREFKEIRTTAGEKGVSVSRYLIEAHETGRDLESFRQECESRPIVRKLEDIRSEIWYIGHNINQIARNVNRDMDATKNDEASAIRAIRECSELLDKVAELIGGMDRTESR